MKRIAYSFLLIFAMSCGSSESHQKNHIVIVQKDSLKKDYILLAVHDSSLVVAPYLEDESVEIATLIGSAEAIPFSLVEQIYHPHHEEMTPLLASITGGFLLGCTAGASLYTDAYVPNGGTKYVAAPYIGMGLGIVIGTLLGHYAQPGDISFSLHSNSEIEKLRRAAFFYVYEPDELKKIK